MGRTTLQHLQTCYFSHHYQTKETYEVMEQKKHWASQTPLLLNSPLYLVQSMFLRTLFHLNHGCESHHPTPSGEEPQRRNFPLLQTFYTFICLHLVISTWLGQAEMTFPASHYWHLLTWEFHHFCFQC